MPLDSCPHCAEKLGESQNFCVSCGKSLLPDPLVGKTIEGRYEVIRLLDSGAMGAVYEVRHLRLGKRFAMKVIRRELSCSPEYATRFEREALSTSRLQHPNCIAVTDYGQAESGDLYLVMEYLEGTPLSKQVGTPLPVSRALDVVRKILLGLKHAHDAGVVHRDVKPENVMLIEPADSAVDRNWEVKLVDFGIATLPSDLMTDPGKGTQANLLMGTPEYMAPEQALGPKVDQRADLYAVGAILWVLLTGRSLFTAENYVKLLKIKMSRKAPALRNVAPGVFSVELQKVLAKALERDPDHRFQTADEFIDAVTRVQRAPGGGLAIPPRGLIGKSRAAIEYTASRVAHWYRCVEIPGTPSWRLRGRSLLTTRSGRFVLTLGIVACGLSVASWYVWKRSTARDTPPISLVERKRVPSKAVVATRASTPSTASTVPAASETLTQTLERLKKEIIDGHCREASLELKNVLTDNSDEAQAHYLLGASLICRELFEEALDAYRRAIDLDEDYREDARISEDLGFVIAHQKTPLTLKIDALRTLSQLATDHAAERVLEATTHARKDLRRAAVEEAVRMGLGGTIDWTTTLSMDLMQSVCFAKRHRDYEKNQKELKAVIQKLAAIDDVRVRNVLINARRAQAGKWYRRYPQFGCVHKDLDKALKSYDARNPPSKQGK